MNANSPGQPHRRWILSLASVLFLLLLVGIGLLSAGGTKAAFPVEAQGLVPVQGSGQSQGNLSIGFIAVDSGSQPEVTYSIPFVDGPLGAPTPTPTPSQAPTNTATTAPTDTVAPTATTAPTDTVPPTAPINTATMAPTDTVVATETTATMTPEPTCTISFEDVPEGSTFYPYIQCMACQGIINGYPCGGPGEPCDGGNNPYFRPSNNVTRGQFAKIAANAAGFNEPSGEQQFEDVAPGSTFFDFIWRLSNRELVTGYTCGGAGEPCGPGSLPYFRPNANVTRGQIAKIDSNAAGYTEPSGEQQFEDVAPGSTFYDFIWRLYDRGLVSGYPCGGATEPCGPDSLPYFRPSANATRGQASKIVSSTFFPECSPSQEAK